jgi:RND family efflux transporter MFP subunit
VLADVAGVFNMGGPCFRGLAGAVLLVLCALGGGARGQSGVPIPAVAVANPLAKHIVQWDEYTGRFEAVQRVEIRPRVSGYIEQVNFTDGAIVHQGDVLFTIDPRPYQIAVDQARADVLRAQAEVQRSSTDYARAEELVKSATATVRDRDQRRANFDTARAQEMSAEAALRNAELNLEWTKVTAPLTGRISDRKVDAGNLVSGSGDATLLTTIVSLDPIYFTFEAAEADYVHYVRMSRAGKRPSSRDAPNPVEVRLADEAGWPHEGHMNFVDNAVDEHSGTIRGRAVFDNKDGFFVPGTFGRMRLFGGYADVLLVPDAAIFSDQAEKIVYVLGPDNVVLGKPVTLGDLAYGLRAITAGLAPADKVIVSGFANPFVRPGAKVVPSAGTITAAADEGAAIPPETAPPAQP